MHIFQRRFTLTNLKSCLKIDRRTQNDVDGRMYFMFFPSKNKIILPPFQCIFHLVETDNVIYQTLAFSPICKLEIWRFLTYAILHAGFAHLTINIILQIVISFPLESEQGHFKVLLVYLGGILSGSLAASMSGDNSLMVGASSGIYSLLMSHASHIIMVKPFFIF